MATGSTQRRGLVWVVLIGAAVITVDQATKWWAQQTLAGQPPVEVIGTFLRLTFTRNPGGAFSIGTQYTWLFTIVASCVALAILYYSRKVTSALWLVALGILLGGALGNFVDRLTQPPAFGQGHVVDWIALPNYPVFNVADMAVVTAAISIVALSLFGVDPTPRMPEPTEPADGVQPVSPGP